MSHFVHVDAAVGVPVGVSVGEKRGRIGGCRWSVGARRRACVTCTSVNAVLDVCVSGHEGWMGRGGDNVSVGLSLSVSPCGCVCALVFVLCACVTVLLC